MQKVLHQVVRLSVYSYTCVHTPRLLNVWADIISRWVAFPTGSWIVSAAILLAFSRDDFIWPTLRKFMSTVDIHSVLRPSRASLASDGLYREEHGAVWVPHVSGGLCEPLGSNQRDGIVSLCWPRLSFHFFSLSACIHACPLIFRRIPCTFKARCRGTVTWRICLFKHLSNNVHVGTST